MPTIISVDGYQVVIFTRDHPPPHVHVIGPNGSVVFNLNCPRGPVEVRTIAGKVPATTIRRIARLIEPEIAVLCAAWRKHHGNQ
jgi:Domain of unknown function (DUF4160)